MQIAKEYGEGYNSVYYRLVRAGVLKQNLGKLELEGKRFGMLSVIKFSHQNKYGSTYWICQCDCGHSSVVIGSSLTSKRRGTKSCGCIAGLKPGSGHKCWKGFGGISGSNWSTIKRSAEARGIEFELKISEGWELYIKQSGMCVLTGRQIRFGPGALNRTASLDRIDSSGIYKIENVQWVHKAINTMKWTHSQEDFISLCKEVASHSTRTLQ